MGWREWDALRTTRAREADLGLVFEAVAAWKRWLIGMPLAALVLTGAVLALQPPRFSAEAQIRIGPRHAGLIGLRANLALMDASAAASQAQLIASRDLGRRAIEDLGLEDNPEFDPVTRGLGPGVRALIFLGIMRDPARKSPHDRVLEAYQDRLQVRTPGGGNLVTIVFQSGDPELAANAANIIADLYLEMRASAKLAAGLPPTADARIVSRAITPKHPVYPRQALMVLSGTAMLVMAFGAFVAMVQPRGPLRATAPLEHPRALGQVRVFARFKDVAESTPRLKLKLDPPPALQGETGDWGDEQATTKIVTRILSMHGRGPRGIRIVVTSLQATGGASCMMLDLARSLARTGRSIVIGPDESYPLDFRFSNGGAQHGGLSAAEPALGDLLAGTASFDEVIRRDAASRLHLLPVGQHGELDLCEFANVIDALTGIYDFVVTIAPPLDRNGIAEALAANTDVVLLAAQGEPRGSAVVEAEARLIESGAREVLLIGLPVEPARILGLDAA